MNSIYNDVEREILSFLINSRSMINVFLINKRWNHLLKSSNFWKTLLLLKENLQMLKEDGDNYLNNYLIEEWEKYTKWLYPIHEFSLKIGDYVDVLDNVKVWGNGIIKNITLFPNDSSPIFYEKKFNIEFLGWSDSFNEIVNIDKIKPFGTKTLNNQDSKYLCLQNLDEYHWVFFKEKGNWNKEKIKFHKKNKDNLTFYIANSLEIFNKKDIDEKIKPCTNAFALLCNNRFEGLIQRNLFI